MTRLNFMVQKINTWPAVARQNLIWSICHFTSSEILMILFTYSVFLFLFSDNPPVFKHKDMHAFKKKNKQIGNDIVYPHYISQTKVNAWIRAGYLATTTPSPASVLLPIQRAAWLWVHCILSSQLIILNFNNGDKIMY